VTELDATRSHQDGDPCYESSELTGWRASAAWAAIPASDDGEFHAFVKNAAGSSSHDVTETASCESLRLHLVELGLGDRSRIEELFGRRDLIGARTATARSDD
jgi:hypothetical protein